MKTGIVVVCRSLCQPFVKLLEALVGAEDNPSSLPIAFFRMVEDAMNKPYLDPGGLLTLQFPRIGFNLRGYAAALSSFLRVLRDVFNKDIRIITRQSCHDGDILGAFLLNCADIETVSCGCDASSLEAAVRFTKEKSLRSLRSLTMRMDRLLQFRPMESDICDGTRGFDLLMHHLLCHAPLLEKLTLSDCFDSNYHRETKYALKSISNALKARDSKGLPPLLKLKLQGIEGVTDENGRIVVDQFKDSLPREILPLLDFQGLLLPKLCGIL